MKPETPNASHATHHFWREMQIKTHQARQVDPQKTKSSRRVQFAGSFRSLIRAKLTQIWRTSCLRIAWRILRMHDRKLNGCRHRLLFAHQLIPRKCSLCSQGSKQDASDYEQNTPEYTYQLNETVFSLRIGQTFFFKSFRKRFKAKSYTSTALLTNTVFTPQSRCTLTPSWHKWSDFEYRPWCLAIVVRTPPARSRKQ